MWERLMTWVKRMNDSTLSGLSDEANRFAGEYERVAGLPTNEFDTKVSLAIAFDAGRKFERLHREAK